MVKMFSELKPHCCLSPIHASFQSSTLARSRTLLQ